MQHDSALFHLQELPHIQAVLERLDRSCLHPQWRAVETSQQELLGSNARLFSGGSAPRDVWAEAAIGATVQATIVASNTSIDLVDLCSMTANTILGINDPWVKLKQIAYLLSDRPHYVTARIGNALYYRVARRILRCFNTATSPGDYVLNLRQCNGSDVVELGLHAAWEANGGSRRRLATFEGSYHGESLTANWVSHHQPGRLLAPRPSSVDFLPSPTADSNGGLTPETVAALEDLERDGDQYFAVIIEPVQWRNSVHVVPLLFLQQLRRICTEKSICLIFDEMQNGFGYTGFISHGEATGVWPDISALSKALTSGHGSLAVMIARQKYGRIQGPFGAKSNSGNMLPLVAADAVLDRLIGMSPSEHERLPEWIPKSLSAELESGLLPQAFLRAEQITMDLLDRLCAEFPTIAYEHRGLGLVRGVLLRDRHGVPSSDVAARVAKVCLKHGAYVRQADTAMLVKPALTITEEEAMGALSALRATLSEVLETS